MSIYSRTGTALAQTEIDLYGSSRLGIYNVNIDVNTCSSNTNTITTFTRGNKFFELTNHLHNVLVTVSDRKMGFDSNNDGVVDYYTANVITANDYYPFGQGINNRQFSLNNSQFRYGFNGKEKDNDIGNGIQDYGFRIYDTRLARFLSVDPITNKYPELTPYQFASNKPIQAIDFDGLEAYIVFDKGTGILLITPDLSKVNPKLGTKVVTAFEYQKLTGQDKSKSNYITQVNNVFTGGIYDAGKKAIVQEGVKKAKQLPISTGKYNILENKGNTDVVHSSFFVLDPVDSHQYDKVDDRPGETNSSGEKRTGYELHPGLESWGCVTICKADKNMTPADRALEWSIVNKAINDTKTETVPDNRGKHEYIPFSTQIKFGTLEVIDSSKPPLGSAKPPATGTGGH